MDSSQTDETMAPGVETPPSLESEIAAVVREDVCAASEPAASAPAPDVSASEAAPSLADARVEPVTPAAIAPPSAKSAASAEISLAAPRLKPPGSPSQPVRQPLWRRIDAFQAAGVAVALGLGWIVGANMLDGRSDTARLQTEVSALGRKVAAIETLSAHAPRSAEIKSLQQGEARLGRAIRIQKLRLEESDRQAQARFARTAVQIDHIEKSNRLTQISARVSRLEHQVSSHLPTASIAPPVAAQTVTASARPAPPLPAPIVDRVKEESRSASASAPAPALPAEREEDARSRRTDIPATGYVLRDVYRGVALVESRDGTRVIAPGDRLPGAGRVMRIVKRGRDWVVVTSQGTIDANKY